MKKLLFLALGLSINALALAVSATLSLAQVTDSCGGGCPKPPSNVRAVSQFCAILAPFPGNTLSATLAKGKKKRVLMVDAMLTDGSFGPLLVSREYDLGASVNGLTMQPPPGNNGGRDTAEDCGAFRSDPDRLCAVTGQWWVDMDDPAYAALIGVPITVTMIAGDAAGGPAVGTCVNTSLRVRLEKK